MNIQQRNMFMILRKEPLTHVTRQTKIHQWYISDLWSLKSLHVRASLEVTVMIPYMARVGSRIASMIENPIFPT